MATSHFVLLFNIMLLLIPFISKHLNLNNRQFGYRQGTGCMMAAAIVREAILQFTTKNTNVHAAILDMSKAFHRIKITFNHKKLFMKLIDTSLPPQIVKIINCICRDCCFLSM